ncbi:hypothetical protein NDU88_005502 [Pleurodeles waltl]|uniref:Uncharacterized protein n=1 Tax=Pleurodeles waltl TaxID=8319 RepID=A0AAV7TU51_PLEWA|nr:hypothetical protein NDU88_005502 [Pleurodeles waltl]
MAACRSLSESWPRRVSPAPPPSAPSVIAASALHSSGHLFQRALSLQYRRSLRFVSQELAVTNQPPISTTWWQPRDSCLCRLSTPFFRPPLPVHSLPAAPPQSQSRLIRACHYQLDSDLHHPPPSTRFAPSLSHHPVLQATSSSALSPYGTTTASGPSHKSLLLPIGLRSAPPAGWPVLSPSQHPALQATSSSAFYPCSTAAAPGQSQKSLPLLISLRSASPATGRVACASTVSAPRSAGHLFKHTLSLQHCRSLRAVSQECAVASRPLICTAGRQPRSPQLHCLSATFFMPPLAAHSLPAAASQPQGRLPRAYCYQLASDLHRRPPAAWPEPSPSQHPGLQASRGSRLPTRPHSELGWRPPCGSQFRASGSRPRAPQASAHCSTIPIPSRDPSGAIKERISSRPRRNNAFTHPPLLPLRPRPPSFP